MEKIVIAAWFCGPVGVMNRVELFDNRAAATRLPRGASIRKDEAKRLIQRGARFETAPCNCAVCGSPAAHASGLLVGPTDAEVTQLKEELGIFADEVTETAIRQLRAVFGIPIERVTGSQPRVTWTNRSPPVEINQEMFREPQWGQGNFWVGPGNGRLGSHSPGQPGFAIEVEQRWHEREPGEELRLIRVLVWPDVDVADLCATLAAIEQERRRRLPKRPVAITIQTRLVLDVGCPELCGEGDTGDADRPVFTVAELQTGRAIACSGSMGNDSVTVRMEADGRITVTVTWEGHTDTDEYQTVQVWLDAKSDPRAPLQLKC